MRGYLKVFALSLALITSAALGLYYFAFNEKDEMLSYRTCKDEVTTRRLKKNPDLPKILNRQGLEELNISGSGHLNIDFFVNYQNEIQRPLTVVNLAPYENVYLSDHKLEYYGLIFVEGKVAEADSGASFNKRLKYLVRRFFHGIPQNDPDAWQSMLKTEREMLASKGIKQLRIMYPIDKPDIVPNGDCWESDWRWVDHYIEFMEATPKGTYIHFHCEHGRGRTTTAMLMYDLFHNWRHVSLEEAHKRHWAIGGSNLIHCKWVPKGSWTKEQLEARNYLIKFYDQYIRDEQQGYGKRKFSEWLSLKGEKIIRNEDVINATNNLQ